MMDLLGMMRGWGIPVPWRVPTSPSSMMPDLKRRFVDPLIAKELFVKGSMIVPTVTEGFANIRIEVAETMTVNPGWGDTSEQRRLLADRELSAVLADLMAKAEVIRSGHLIQTVPRPMLPPRERQE